MGPRSRQTALVSALSIVGAFIALGTPTLGQPVVFVDVDAPPGGDGESWETAYADLQDALDRATNEPAVEEVWIAEGEYRPDRGSGDPALSFVVRPGLDLYGGFAGNEVIREQRDPATHVSTLSGAIDPGQGIYTLRVVVIPEGAGPDTRLDGCVLSQGRALGSRQERTDSGGGLYAVNAAPTIYQCLFLENQAKYRGAGAFVGGSGMVAVFDDCTFEANAGPIEGGLRGGALAGLCRLRDCRFVANVAFRGGAIYCDIEVDVERCVFERNMSTEEGGAVRVESNAPFAATDCLFDRNSAATGGGAASVIGTASSFTNCQFVANDSSLDAGAIFFQHNRTNEIVPFEVTGCAFRGNTALRDGGACLATDPAPIRFLHCDFVGNAAQRDGGAVAGLAVGSNSCGVTLWNSTVAANTAGGRGGGMYLRGTRATAYIENSILWANADSTGSGEDAQITNIGGSVIVRYSDVQEWTGSLGGDGNFDADPLFVDLAGADLIIGTLDDDVHQASGSPCIDAGDNGVLPPSVLSDLDGLPRYMDDPDAPDSGLGTSPIIDLGPYEVEGRVFVMQTPVPGVAGELNVFSVRGAPPHTTVHFLWAMRPGRTRVPGCPPGTVLDIAGPQILGTAFASIRGNADIGLLVPAPARGRAVLLQAVQLDECVVSDALEFTFE